LANTASPAWKFRKPDHSVLADSTQITFVVPFTLGKGARLDDRRRALRPHAAGPVALGRGQRLVPRRAAAPVALGRGQRLPPRRAAAPVVPGLGQRLLPRRAVEPADAEFPPAEPV